MLPLKLPYYADKEIKVLLESLDKYMREQWSEKKFNDEKSLVLQYTLLKSIQAAYRTSGTSALDELFEEEISPNKDNVWIEEHLNNIKKLHKQKKSKLSLNNPEMLIEFLDQYMDNKVINVKVGKESDINKLRRYQHRISIISEFIKAVKELFSRKKETVNISRNTNIKKNDISSFLSFHTDKERGYTERLKKVKKEYYFGESRENERLALHLLTEGLNDIKNSNKSDEEKLQLTYGLLQKVFESTYGGSFVSDNPYYTSIICDEKDWKLIKQCISDFHNSISDAINLDTNICKEIFLEFAKENKKYSGFIKYEDSKKIQNRNKLFELSEVAAIHSLLSKLGEIKKPKHVADNAKKIIKNLDNIIWEPTNAKRLELLIGLRELAREDSSSQIKHIFKEIDPYISMQYHSHLVDHKVAKQAFLDWKNPKQQNANDGAGKPNAPHPSLIHLHKPDKGQKQEGGKTHSDKTAVKKPNIRK